jgi:uridine kinase
VVAVSGIDGSGKSHVAGLLERELTSHGLSAVVLPLDVWHTHPSIRFSDSDPGRHFYEHAFRFGELFELVVLPLQRRRAVCVEIELARMPGWQPYRERFDHRGVDVVIIEGIFLLKREFRPHYDLTVWIECSFGTALERAVSRNQEGLSEEALREEYARIYFPAQAYHVARDGPHASASLVLQNDSSQRRA